jgi:hypothetical protein
MVVGGMAILLFGRELHAGTIAVDLHTGPHAGIGVWIGTPAPAPEWRPPMYGRVVVPGPRHHRPGWVLPPHREVVVVRPPVVVERPVIVRPPAPVVETCTITLWITNSNGSRTSVQLTRQGPWYIGPRGEYYADMPTNEQLRVVYGF